ncbi:hypothetical protein MW887_008028 [Aspergillus wentii]|nr:hypothetical protein MW887_008028 [Aspergillus wentii]
MRDPADLPAELFTTIIDYAKDGWERSAPQPIGMCHVSHRRYDAAIEHFYHTYEFSAQTRLSINSKKNKLTELCIYKESSTQLPPTDIRDWKDSVECSPLPTFSKLTSASLPDYLLAKCDHSKQPFKLANHLPLTLEHLTLFPAGTLEQMKRDLFDQLLSVVESGTVPLKSITISTEDPKIPTVSFSTDRRDEQWPILWPHSIPSLEHHAWKRQDYEEYCASNIHGLAMYGGLSLAPNTRTPGEATSGAFISMGANTNANTYRPPVRTTMPPAGAFLPMGGAYMPPAGTFMPTAIDRAFTLSSREKRVRRGGGIDESSQYYIDGMNKLYQDYLADIGD